MENVIDEAVEAAFAAEGEVALEDHAIEAADHGCNIRGEVGDEVVVGPYSILLCGCRLI